MKDTSQGPQHKGVSLFSQCIDECDRIMAVAESDCQALWNALHASRSSIHNIDGAMAEVNRCCLKIRDEARKECEQVREASRSTRMKLATSNYGFAD